MPFEYPCPDCWTTNNIHERDCRFASREWTDIEKAYVDIIAVLAQGPHTERELREVVHDGWDALTEAALEGLEQRRRLRETEDGLELLTPEEYREEVAEPSIEPLRTIHRKGSVPGAHDNAIFALIAWYEMVGLSWEETRREVIDWLAESGTWDRGGFEEESPEELLESKRHVYEAGYGWKEKARAAKAVIDRSL